MRAGLSAALRRVRNADGGWGYSGGKRTRLEPTCWALLALAAADGRPIEIDLLRAWPRHDGWLVDVSGAPVNQPFNALAALTLLQDRSAAPLAQPIVSNLVSSKSEGYPDNEYLTQDSSIRAWSWVDGTASWVEPTAWSLLLLKKVRSNGSLPSPGHVRIDTGEHLLFDRVCSGGGWNYGNTRVFGHDLWPYVPTTALALLALQDRRDLSSVRRSLDEMRTDLLTERSALALALALVCLQVYGTDSGNAAATSGGSKLDGAEVEHALAQIAATNLETTENILGQAMALYALSDPARAPRIFSF